MPNSGINKQRLITRVRRIRGQMGGVERMLADDGSSVKILQTIAAIRGALSGLSAQIIESHIQSMATLGAKQADREKAFDEMKDIVRAYFR